MGHFKIVGLSHLSQMLGTVNLSLYEDKFSGGQHGGVEGCKCRPPPQAPQQYLQERLCVQCTSTACFTSTPQRLLTTARLSPIATTTTRRTTRFALSRDVHSFMSTMPTPALSKCQILPVRFLADRFKSSYLLRQTCLTLTDSMVFSLGKRIK